MVATTYSKKFYVPIIEKQGNIKKNKQQSKLERTLE